MNPLGLPDYVSDATQFIESLKRSKPELEAQQRAGRALLWDRPLDREFWQQAQRARVPQKPYVYQTEPSLK
ncbi:hypothetical protein Tther_01028 [Tepidimonas thermarum]|uniref:Acetyl-CoA carboxyl transferase n=1 Tax=Tepidimonas thermarum TaxID=335431 RepID=A0A554X3A2_9BURK|nr:DUF3460 family protein [Tepidimonas thermarum]TSE30324.1 hypothetical protein Tther_01028 [Tepidimonas thermarum]